MAKEHWDRVSWVVLLVFSRSSSLFCDGASVGVGKIFDRDSPYKASTEAATPHYPLPFHSYHVLRADAEAAGGSPTTEPEPKPARLLEPKRRAAVAATRLYV